MPIMCSLFFLIFFERVKRMSIYQRIKDLANEKNISIRELEKQLDFSNGAVNKWRTKAPSDKLEKVANYFDVTTDYLLGRTNIQDKRPSRVRKLKDKGPVEEYEDNHAYYNERAILIHTFDTLVNLLVLNGFETYTTPISSEEFEDTYNYYQEIMVNYSGASKEKIARTFLELMAPTITIIDSNKSDIDKILKDVYDFEEFMWSKYNKYNPSDFSDFDIPF